MAVLTSYLKKLRFDKSLENSLIASYLRNQRLVILSLILICIIGILSFFSLPKVLNPAINIAIVNVTTILPGAGPSEIESLVTVPIEEAVGNVANIDTMTSSSQNSVSNVVLQFNSGVNPDKAASDVQTAVQSVSTLPKDASTPHVQKLDFQNSPVWIFSVSAQDPISLKQFSRNLRDRLKDVPSLNTIAVSGLDNQEIQVVIKPEAIATYGINPGQLSQTVTTAINSQPAGNVNTETSSFTLAIDPTVSSIEDLRNLVIQLPDNTSVALSDIAAVSYRPVPDSVSSYISSPSQRPTQSVTFTVFKKSYANITSADADAHKAVTDLAKANPSPINIANVLDSGSEINRQFLELVRDLLITFVLVFLVIVIFLGTRQAIIAAAAIPLTFLITFTVMKSSGVDLSFIAFFSLLLSLGLLVDDTIVVISALSAYLKIKKFTPLQAGLLVWRDFKTAILTTTLTTVWAFVPLLLSTGIIGEFIKPIPIVVSSSLLSSFGVAMFITLPLVIMFVKPKVPKRVRLLLWGIVCLFVVILFFTLSPKGLLFLPALILFALAIFIFAVAHEELIGGGKKKMGNFFEKHTAFVKKYHFGEKLENGFISFDLISKKYRSVLHRILISPANRKKTLAMVIVFSVFSYFLLPLGFVRNEFFPSSAQQLFFVSLEMPPGTNFQTTSSEALKILNDVRKLPEVQSASLSVGQGADTGMGAAADSGSNIASITVALPPVSEQKISSIDLAQKVRTKYSQYQKGKVSVLEESGGPPAGADVQIKLFGDSLSTLDNLANTVEEYLKKQPGIINVDKSIKSGTSKIAFTPNYKEMIDAGVSQNDAALWLRTFASGFTLDSNVKIETGNSQGQDIVFRTDDQTQLVNNLNSIMVSTKKGQVPLISLGTLSIRPNPTLITRESGKRTISVTAGISKGYSVSEANNKLQKFADSLNLSNGYSWQAGGVNQQNQDSLTSIFAAMVLSFLLIIVTMVLQFRSFRKAFIVMLVIPLSISGVFIVFSITRTPLSFPALIGMLALFGIVVKNSILVVDKINQNLKVGLPFVESIVDASESRLEPIALTSFTAIIGLIPITLSNALWQGLGGAIIAGLMFSGSIMLFFIPVVYYYFFVGSEGKQKAK